MAVMADHDGAVSEPSVGPGSQRARVRLDRPKRALDPHGQKKARKQYLYWFPIWMEAGIFEAHEMGLMRLPHPREAAPAPRPKPRSLGRGCPIIFVGVSPPLGRWVAEKVAVAVTFFGGLS